MGNVIMSGIVPKLTKPRAKLPAGYTELGYIQSSGAQYINTEFNPNQDTRVVIDVDVLSSQAAEGHFASCIGGGYYYTLYVNASRVCGTRYAAQALKTFGSALSAGTRYVIDKNKNVTTIGENSATHTAATFQMAYPLTIFCRNNAGTKDRYISTKLYSCQIYDNGTLVRDFVPAKRDSDGVAGLYDLVNKVFYASASSTDFIAGPMTELPAGYTKLAYIESTGPQYFNLGFKANQNTRMIADVDITAASAERAIFGARTASKNTAFCVWTAPNNNGYQSDYGSQMATPVGSNSTGRHLIDRNKNVLTVDGAVVHTHTAGTFQTAYDMYLLQVNNKGSILTGYPFAGKLYFCQAYDNETLIRDLVPCISDADGVGLCDLVNGVFYGNAGTGTFIGSEVA